MMPAFGLDRTSPHDYQERSGRQNASALAKGSASQREGREAAIVVPEARLRRDGLAGPAPAEARAKRLSPRTPDGVLDSVLTGFY